MRWGRTLAAIALAAAFLHAGDAAEAARATADRADASALYNEGTDALARGSLGRAVLFLLAAKRIDPRARDIRTNLAIARARVEEIQGAQTSGGARVPSPFTISQRDGWALSGALAFVGALLAWTASLRPDRRRLFLAGGAAFATGVLLFGGLALRAVEERRHPEAVVVAPVLDVMPAPDERPLSPYLLAEGEEVRLGKSRGDLVAVRVGGNAIGWARRAGLWRVADAPRYTEKSGSR